MIDKTKIMINLESDGDLELLDAISGVDERVDDVEKKVKDIDQKAAVKKDEIIQIVKDNTPDLKRVLKSVRGKRGRKGETGDRGPKGDKGETGAGRPGKDGKDGKAGKDGKNGKNGLDGKNGRDGVDGEDGIQGERGEKGEKGDIGEKGDVPKHEWRGTMLGFENPDGKITTYVDLKGSGGRGPTGGGNLETFLGSTKVGSSQRLYFKEGSGITLSGSNEAGGTGVTISSTATTDFVDDETPTGLVNGVNTDFELANTPIPTTSLKVYVNGSRMRITEDYTLSGTTITFITAPPTGSIILTDYRK